MKTSITLNTIKACFVLIILASCESHDQKHNDAFDRFKKEKMTSTDSIENIKEISKIENKTEPLKTTENTDEWVKFKNETEKKILANENKIKRIKQTPEANVRLFKKIIRLEKDNDDLRLQLKVYEEEVKVNLEKFKEKINLKAKEIDTKLKDISISEKK